MSVHTIDLDAPTPTSKPSSGKSKKVKNPNPSQLSRWQRLHNWVVGHRLLVIVLAIACLGLAGGMAWFSWASPSTTLTNLTNSGPTPTPTPEIPSIPNPLNGVLYTTAEAATHADLRPITVMVENHTESRPQSGLAEAEVLYEGMAEGGITRFMAVYLHNAPAKIGPVRSARQHFVDWAAEYDAVYAHWGGSAEALQYLRNNSRPRDLDQFFNPGAFYRDYSGGKSLEHTGYTSTELLRQVVRNKGWEQTPVFKPWSFQEEVAVAERPVSQVITLQFLGLPGYQAKFEYRPTTNDYGRLTAGQPHVDAAGTQLTAKTIVLQFQSAVGYADAGGHAAVRVTTNGSGRAIVVRDGRAIEGQWSKSATNVRTTFTDDSGQEIALNRGLVWVVSVPSGSSYTIE